MPEVLFPLRVSIDIQRGGTLIRLARTFQDSTNQWPANGLSVKSKAWDRSGSLEECLDFSEEWDKIGQIEVRPMGAIIENDEVQ